MVQNHERLEAGTNSFIGMAFREIEGKPGEYGFVVLDDVVEVPYRVEYVQALRAGDLIAANEATADAVGIKFEATKRAFASSGQSSPPAPHTKDGNR